MPYKSKNGFDPLGGTLFFSSILCTEFKIKKVIFNDPATIVYWNDGSKTVVKCKNEPFDKEKGLAMCCMKKLLGNKGHYYEEVKKWAKSEEPSCHPDYCDI